MATVFGTYTSSEIEEENEEQEALPKNELFIIPSEVDRRYPEMYDAETGDQIVVALVNITIQPSPVSPKGGGSSEPIDGIIGEAVEVAIEKGIDVANRYLDKSVQKYALIQLEKGNLATTNPKVTLGPKTSSGGTRIVSFKTICTNNGKSVRLLMANNFAYVKGGKTISTKGIDQVGHFASKHWSNVTGIKGILKNTGALIGTLIDLSDMTRAVANGEKPEIPIPVPFANMLIDMILESTFGDIEREVEATLQKNFNILKTEGLNTVKNYISRRSSFVKERGYDTIPVSSNTLSEILTGKETDMENVFSKYEPNPDATILYRKVDNPKTAGYIYLVETLFFH